MTGIGYDVHQFAEDRPLVLGGVTIPHSHGLAGHSDADVLCHAIADAVLGALGQPDIGHFFPPGDPACLGISSLKILEKCRELADVVAMEHGNIHRSSELGAAALVRLLERCDALRKPQRFANLLAAMQCSAMADAGAAPAVYPQRQRLLVALAAAQAIAADTIAKDAMARGLQGPAIGELLQQPRVVAVATALGWQAAPG